jgi:hypothetical protein
MRPKAKRVVTAVAMLLIVSVLLSGCIVCVDDVFCDDRPPRMATLTVYALDYYSGAPIPWAHVELYESHWWTWDYLGTWPVGPGGYARLHCGYLYHDGCGGQEEEDYRVVVYASGYHSERFDIELSYYYPAETLYYYLYPSYAREVGETDPGTAIESGPTGVGTAESWETRGKVEVGEQESAEPSKR